MGGWREGSGQEIEDEDWKRLSLVVIAVVRSSVGEEIDREERDKIKRKKLGQQIFGKV